MRFSAARKSRLIELLEPRALLTAAVWTGTAGDGDWSNAANWQANAVTAADQDISLPFISSSQMNITLNSNVPVGDILLDGNYRFINMAPKIDGDLSVTANSTDTQFAVPALGHDLTITIAAGGEVEFTSPIDNGNNFGITKNGDGHFLFDGGFTSIGGATRINAGTIELDSIIPSLDLQPGTILTGNGNPGDLSADHATVSLSQGTDAQSYNITGNFTLASGSTLRETLSKSGPFQRNGSLFVSGSGTVDITGATLDVAVLTNGYTPTIGTSFTLIVANNNQPVVGHFKQLPEGGVITENGFSFRISYVDGSGHDVSLTAINPPASTTPTIASVMSGTSTTTTNQALTILGADTSANGESGLLYTWNVSSAPAGARAPDFADNGTNSAKNTTMTFHKAGQYHVRCTITNLEGNSVTAGVTIRVIQHASSLRVSPHAQTIARGSTQQFSATTYDQFRKPIATTSDPQWTIEQGEGEIDDAGLFTPGAHRGHVLIEATFGALIGEVGATVR